MRREADEEIGLRGNFKCEFVDRAVYNRHVLGRQENHLFVVYKSYSDAQPILNHESESCKYFTEDELRNELRERPQLFGDAFHFVVKRFFPHLREDASIEADCPLLR